MKKKKNIEKVYPLSPMQEGMYFHWALDRQSDAYFEQVDFTFEGEVEHPLLHQSINRLVRRYDILRSRFVHQKVQSPRQVVLREKQVPLPFEDLTRRPVEDRGREHIEAFKKADRGRGFDLARDMLMRTALFKTGEQSYRLIWSFHHILMDGWCLGILFKELSVIYDALKTGREPRLEPVTPYRDYILWLQTQDKTEGLEYWRTVLDDYEQPAELPRRGVGDGGAYLRETFSITMDPPLTAALDHMAKSSGATLNTLFQVLWGLLLQRYNNTDDVVFGAVTAGRPAELDGIENMVGLFINTVPLRIRRGDADTVSRLIEAVQQRSVRAKAYEYIPLAEIQSNHLLKNRLIHHIVAFENFPSVEELGGGADAGTGGPGFRVTDTRVFEQTNYDFTIVVSPGSSLTVEFLYNRNVHDPVFMERIPAHLITLARQAAADPGLPLHCLDILSPGEKQQLLHEFNDTQTPYPHDKTIHQLFREQAEQTPERNALLGLGAGPGVEPMTYGDLDKQSDRLASELIEKGAGPETVVAVMADRSVETIVAVLGVLKAGGAYLPIDPSYPEDRKQYMLEDSGARFVLSEISLREKLCGAFSKGGRRPQPHGRAAGGLAGTGAAGLAYIIYTSGSTGRPKGVMVEHRNVVRLVKNTNYVPFDGDDRLLQTGDLGFDASTFEIWGSLLNGLLLVLSDRELVLSPDRLKQTVREQGITMMWMTAPLFNRMVQADIDIFEGLRYLLVGGDVLSPPHINRVREQYPGLVVINGYGPTENTTFSTTYHIKESFSHGIPIGKPIANSTAYIVDRWDRLQPVGVAGELVVGGDGVARGYLNNPELTAARFGEPDRSYGSYRSYKTGDLARRLPDGDIEFLGRIDRQVKIRGFRIEMGEIEAHLLKIESIHEARVIAREDVSGEKVLTAYMVSDHEPDTAALTDTLSRQLPDYMLPAFYIRVDKMPLTANGKLDIDALPAPGPAEPGAVDTRPRDQVEQQVHDIWSEILGIKDIDIDADFFQLGGHSLKATMMVSQLHKELEVNVPLTEVFMAPTIRRLAEYIHSRDREGFIAVEAVEKRDYYPLSPAQRSIYIQQQKDPDNLGYNMSKVFRVKGRLEKERVEAILKGLIRRHESFRTSFVIAGDQPVQRVHDSAPFSLDYYEMKDGDVRDFVKRFVRPFDLARPPLLRAGLIKEDEESFIWMFDMHHTIYDGISVSVFIKEFTALYTGEAEPPPLKIQYKDFVCRRQSPDGLRRLKEQETFWLKQLSGDLPRLDLPLDFPRPKLQTFQGDHVLSVIGEKESRALNELAAGEKVTLFTVLFSLYALLLSRLSDQADIIVGTGVAARRHADLHSIIGMFVNNLALRCFPSPEKCFTDFLKETGQRVLDAFENQEYPLEELVNHLPINRDVSRNPLFDAMFMLQNISSSKSKQSGLQLEPIAPGNETAHFDLMLSAREGRGIIHLSWEYAVALFKPETIETFAEYYMEIIKQVTADPTLPLGHIQMAHGVVEADADTSPGLRDEWNL